MQGLVSGWFRAMGLLALLTGAAFSQGGAETGPATPPPAAPAGSLPMAGNAHHQPMPYPATGAGWGAPYHAVWNDTAAEPGVQLARSLPPIHAAGAAGQQLPAPPPGAMPPEPIEELAVPAVEGVIAAEAGGEAEIIVPAEPVPPIKLWEGNVELGINGSSGNSETFNLRAGGQAKRKTDRSLLSLMTTYLQNSSDGDVTANRSFSEARHEWLNASRWTPYVHGLMEYDEFRNFDLRLTADAGVGYQFIDTDATTLLARAGFGGSKEIDSPDDDFKPEAVFGAEFSHQLSARQSLELNVDYYPSVEDLNDYRINSTLNWVFVLDEENNLSLKLGVIDRYDSTPSGAKYNDIDYSLLLLWAF